jgi:hypothetical protein
MDDLKEESEPDLLVALAWSWLDHLKVSMQISFWLKLLFKFLFKVPVLRVQEIISLINESKTELSSTKWEVLDKVRFN